MKSNGRVRKVRSVAQWEIHHSVLVLTTSNLSTKLTFGYIAGWSGWQYKRTALRICAIRFARTLLYVVSVAWDLGRRHHKMAIEQALVKLLYKCSLADSHAKVCTTSARNASHILRQIGNCLKKGIYNMSESCLSNDRRRKVRTIRSSSRH